MGVCYTLILMDEFDWGSDEDKKTSLNSFRESYLQAGAYCCELIGQWYGFAVFDVDKRGPYIDERKAVVKSFSDRAWFIADNEFSRIRDIDD